MPGYEHAHRYVAASLIFERGRILDLASGSGVGTSALRASASPDLHVIGLDLDVESARSASPAVQGDATRLPFVDSSFDGVICFEAIEHLEEPARLLEETRRVLRPGGIALFSTPNRDLYTERAGRENPFHISEMNPREFLEVLRTAFPHVGLYAQSVWAGSWIAELDDDGARPESSKARWNIASRDLSPLGEDESAPWAEPEDVRVPLPLYLMAVCARSARALGRARRIVGANHLLHDRAQWLLGHYLSSLEGMVDRDALVASHARHARNLESRLGASLARSHELEVHVANVERERASAIHRVETLQVHSANTAEREAQHRERIERLEEHARNLEAERGRLQDRLDRLEEHVGNVEDLLRAQTTHAANLDAERAALSERIQALLDHARNLASAEEAQRAHAQNLQTMLEARSQHAENLETALEGQTRHASNLEAVREGLQARIDEADGSIARLEEELRTQTQRIRDVHAALLEEQGRSQKLEREIAGRSHERDEWRTRAETTAAELTDLRSSRTVRIVSWIRSNLGSR